MTDLINRIEEARAEDARGLRDLDVGIARALGFGCVAQDPQASGDGWTAWEGPLFRSGPWQPLPYYTTSVDAALLLVPEGWSCSMGELPGRGWVWRVHLRDHREPYNPSTCAWVEGHHMCLALAIAAASLRARGE